MSNTRNRTKPLEPLDLDVLLAETKNEPYTFTLGGAERTLPHAKTLTVGQLRALDRGEIDEVLPEIADEETSDVVVALPAFALDSLIDRWLKHSGIDMGK